MYALNFFFYFLNLTGSLLILHAQPISSWLLFSAADTWLPWWVAAFLWGTCPSCTALFWTSPPIRHGQCVLAWQFGHTHAQYGESDPMTSRTTVLAVCVHLPGWGAHIMGFGPSVSSVDFSPGGSWLETFSEVRLCPCACVSFWLAIYGCLTVYIFADSIDCLRSGLATYTQRNSLTRP